MKTVELTDVNAYQICEILHSRFGGCVIIPEFDKIRFSLKYWMLRLDVNFNIDFPDGRSIRVSGVNDPQATPKTKIENFSTIMSWIEANK